jgi:hypothetical protein
MATVLVIRILLERRHAAMYISIKLKLNYGMTANIINSYSNVIIEQIKYNRNSSNMKLSEAATNSPEMSSD